MAAMLSSVAQAQTRALMPGAWPLGAPPAASAEAPPPLPLPDRSIAVPQGNPAQSGLFPGVGIDAGLIGQGLDPTRRPDDERIRPTDRGLPDAARDTPRAVPGMTLTVPISP